MEQKALLNILMEAIRFLFKMKYINIIIFLFMFLFLMSSCNSKSSDDLDEILCGNDYRIWYSLRDRSKRAQLYHYYGRNGRFEVYRVYNDGRIEEVRSPDCDLSGKWYVVNDSTINRVYDFYIKQINKEKIIIDEDTFSLLKDQKLNSKIKRKIDIDTACGTNVNWNEESFL